MSKFNIMRECWECHGAGEVSPPVPGGTWNDNLPALITCPTCEGSGEASNNWMMLNKLETKINKIASDVNKILAKVKS
jgi:hypothetical protein